MTIPRILVVDDDSDVLDMLKQYLVKNAFAVHTASTAREVETIVAHNRIDLILLDVMLGDDNGFEICRSLREENSVPIIMMSALSADHHRMKGYSSGADDYVAKPFNPDLLLARIQAVVRRTQRSASLSYRRETKHYRFAEWNFDAQSGQLFAKDGFEVVLSRLEVSLLKILLANPFIPLTREEIASVLSGERDPLNTSEFAEGRAVDVLVGRLRSKLEENQKNPAIIKTVRGTGYVLSVEVSTSDE